MAVAISDLAVGRIVGFFGRGIFIELREHAIDTFGIEFGPFLSGVIVQDVAISGVQTSPRLHGGGSGVVAEAVDGFLPALDYAGQLFAVDGFDGLHGSFVAAPGWGVLFVRGRRPGSYPCT